MARSRKTTKTEQITKITVREYTTIDRLCTKYGMDYELIRALNPDIKFNTVLIPGREVRIS